MRSGPLLMDSVVVASLKKVNTAVVQLCGLPVKTLSIPRTIVRKPYWCAEPSGAEGAGGKFVASPTNSKAIFLRIKLISVGPSSSHVDRALRDVLFIDGPALNQ